jgi:hypothetical protein
MKTQRRPAVWSDPAWEAAKSSRRNLGHHEAVAESDFLQRQFRKQWRSNVAASPVDLYEILRTLTKKRIPFVLTGAHAIGGWTGRPRSTQDVDILVKGGRNHVRAVNAMKALYPQLEVRWFHGVAAFFLPGERESVIDVTYPHRADIQETLADPVWVEDTEHGVRYRIPTREAALANKYGAMLALNRDPAKRAVDVADFTWMVRHSFDEGQQPIDLPKLAALGELVWPGGGGEGILHLVEQVKAGQPIELGSTGPPRPGP